MGRRGRPVQARPRQKCYRASIRLMSQVRQFMELAVNIPDHEPQVGQTYGGDLLVGHGLVGGGDHGVDEAESHVLAWSRVT
jgi:hypothetical protein